MVKKAWAVAQVPGDDPQNIGAGCARMNKEGFEVQQVVMTIGRMGQPVYAIVGYSTDPKHFAEADPTSDVETPADPPVPSGLVDPSGLSLNGAKSGMKL